MFLIKLARYSSFRSLPRLTQTPVRQAIQLKILQPSSNAGVSVGFQRNGSSDRFLDALDHEIDLQEKRLEQLLQSGDPFEQTDFRITSKGANLFLQKERNNERLIIAMNINGCALPYSNGPTEAESFKQTNATDITVDEDALTRPEMKGMGDKEATEKEELFGADWEPSLPVHVAPPFQASIQRIGYQGKLLAWCVHTEDVQGDDEVTFRDAPENFDEDDGPLEPSSFRISKLIVHPAAQTLFLPAHSGNIGVTYLAGSKTLYNEYMEVLIERGVDDDLCDFLKTLCQAQYLKLHLKTLRALKRFWLIEVPNDPIRAKNVPILHQAKVNYGPALNMGKISFIRTTKPQPKE